MSTAALGAHLRRYPVWYAVAAVWLVAMLSLPVVRGSALADAFGGGGPAGSAATGGTGAAAPIAPTGGPTGPDGGPLPEGSVAPGPSDDDEPTGADGGPTDDDDLSLVPPELLDLVFDALPPFVVPPVPAEVLPVVRAVAPLAATGCSALGLAGVLVAVAAQTAEGVPVERILPYLAPVSTACASFPIPEVHTVCAADEPLVTDLGGLTTSPPVLGLAIDQLQALEALLSSGFGAPVPALSEELRGQLDCRLVA